MQIEQKIHNKCNTIDYQRIGCNGGVCGNYDCLLPNSALSYDPNTSKYFCTTCSKENSLVNNGGSL